MIELFKKYKTRISIAVAVIAVLTVAYFVGGMPNNSVQTESSVLSETASYTDKSKVSSLSSEEASNTDSDDKTDGKSESKHSDDKSSDVNSKISKSPSKKESDISQSSIKENSDNSTNNSSIKNTELSDYSKNQEDMSVAKPEESPGKSEQSLNQVQSSTEISQNEQKNVCTISISCATILNNTDKLNKTKNQLVPSDGWILKETTVEFDDGDSVFDVLKQTCLNMKIHLEFSKTPIYNSYYIEGINNLYEFDCGSASGWMYRVNNTYKSYSASEIKVKNGDKIEWLYTCDYGKDIGGYFEG